MLDLFFKNVLQVGSTRESISMSLSMYSNSPSVKLYMELYMHLGWWQLFIWSNMNVCYQPCQICAVAPLKEKTTCCFHLAIQKQNQKSHNHLRQDSSKIYLGLEGIPFIIINFNSLMTTIIPEYWMKRYLVSNSSPTARKWKDVTT